MGLALLGGRGSYVGGAVVNWSFQLSFRVLLPFDELKRLMIADDARMKLALLLYLASRRH